MKKYNKAQLLRWGKAFIARILQMDIPLRAAYAGYFLILSVFPALLLLLNSLHYTNLEVQTLVELLHNILPEALHEAAEEIVLSTYRHASGAVAGVSAITAIWSASKGIYAVLRGLNAIYGVSENRGFFYTRGISVLYSVGFLLMLLLTLVLHVFSNWIMQLLLQIDNRLVAAVIGIIDFRMLFLIAVQSLFFTLMFMVLPNKKNGFLESLPGGLFAALGWMGFSNLYSMYVKFFSGYASVYGSVYAISVTMLWLYFCVSIFLFGGAINRLLSFWMGRNKVE